MLLAVDDCAEDADHKVRFGTVKERLGRLGDCDHVDQVLQLDGRRDKWRHCEAPLSRAGSFPP